MTEGLQVALVGESLFFHQYAFHKREIAFHRASMRSYADLMRNRDLDVTYIGFDDQRSDIRTLGPWLRSENFHHLQCVSLQTRFAAGSWSCL